MVSQDILTKITSLNKEYEDASAQEVLYHFIDDYKNHIAFATSLSAEDQVITHMINAIDPGVKIFTLDTGRLFQETYDLIEKTNSRFNIKIDIYFPDTENVENMVREKGINLFYSSVENRKLCCHIRKIEPLQRALMGMNVWISGLRNQQSITRRDTRLIDWDSNFELIKISPLINWTEDAVWDYIENYNLPFNPLHKKGYPSIGCQPCTRPVKPGEDVRSGRWWWENPELKECGLHKK